MRWSPTRALQSTDDDGRQHAEHVRSHLSLMIGTAGLPHVIMRFFTVPKVADARISAGWALVFIAILYTTAPAGCHGQDESDPHRDLRAVMKGRPYSADAQIRRTSVLTG